MTTRRGFLGAILAAAAAPAVARSDSLMRIIVPAPLTLWGDGLHDDTAALQAILAGGTVMHAGARLGLQDGRFFLPRGDFRVSDTLVWSPRSPEMVIDSSHFDAAPDMPPEKDMLRVDFGARGVVKNCYFNRGLQVRRAA